MDTVGGDPPTNNASWVDIEGPTFPSARYSSNEVSVATVLWDIFDDPTDSSITGSIPEVFDTLTLGSDEIWDVFTQSLPNKSLAKLGTFWEGWFDRGHNALSGMTSIFVDRGINFSQDVFETDSPTFNPNRKLTVGSTEAHTLYLSDDIDIVAFDAVANSFYTVQTETLTNGADTFIEIFDPTPSFIASSDNRDGQIYASDCALNCPKNDFETLSSLQSFMALQTGVHYVRITRSPSVPPSAGLFGSYVLRIKSP